MWSMEHLLRSGNEKYIEKCGINYDPEYFQSDDKRIYLLKMGCYTVGMKTIELHMTQFGYAVIQLVLQYAIKDKNADQIIIAIHKTGIVSYPELIREYTIKYHGISGLPDFGRCSKDFTYAIQYHAFNTPELVSKYKEQIFSNVAASMLYEYCTEILITGLNLSLKAIQAYVDNVIHRDRVDVFRMLIKSGLYIFDREHLGESIDSGKTREIYVTLFEMLPDEEKMYDKSSLRSAMEDNSLNPNVFEYLWNTNRILSDRIKLIQFFWREIIDQLPNDGLMITVLSTGKKSYLTNISRMLKYIAGTECIIKYLEPDGFAMGAIFRYFNGYPAPNEFLDNLMKKYWKHHTALTPGLCD